MHVLIFYLRIKTDRSKPSVETSFHWGDGNVRIERVTSVDLHSPLMPRSLSDSKPPPSHRNSLSFCLVREILRNISNSGSWKIVLNICFGIYKPGLFPHPVSETNPRQLLARAIYTRFLSFENNNGHVLSHKLKCIIPRHFWGWHKKRKQMWEPRALLWGRGIAAWSVFIAGTVSDAVTYQYI